jgi:hypothetical protein
MFSGLVRLCMRSLDVGNVPWGNARVCGVASQEQFASKANVLDRDFPEEWQGLQVGY